MEMSGIEKPGRFRQKRCRVVIGRGHCGNRLVSLLLDCRPLLLVRGFPYRLSYGVGEELPQKPQLIYYYIIIICFFGLLWVCAYVIYHFLFFSFMSFSLRTIYKNSFIYLFIKYPNGFRIYLCTYVFGIIRLRHVCYIKV